MTISRRDFVKVGAGAAVGGAVLGSKLWATPRNLPLGIQLYTVRDLLAKDFEGTLHDVHSAGFVEVEAAGYYGRSAAEFKQAVEGAGLKCVSVHHSLGDLLAKPELIDYVHNLGASYLICSSPRTKDGSDRELTLDDWKWNADQFNKLGEKTKTAGLQFGYHNHVHEFKKLDGVVAYDELLKDTDAKLVTMEMDCGWVFVGGFKPADYLKKYPNRFSLLHVKDMVSNGNEHKSTELGRGSIDYKTVFAAAKNVKHYFYEQEEFEIPAVQALKISADYLNNLK
ncbi:MAG: sugar phosphate isomerase/epimerase family protein [Terriglobales bacterium]